MKSRITPMKEREARRRVLSERAFEGELSTDGLVAPRDGRGAYAAESGCADAHASPYEAIGFPPPTECPGLCGTLCRLIELAGFGEERWS